MAKIMWRNVRYNHKTRRGESKIKRGQ